MPVVRIFLLSAVLLLAAQWLCVTWRIFLFGATTNDYNWLVTVGCFTEDTDKSRSTTTDLNNKTSKVRRSPNRRQHAIVIPFRNRTEHLEGFIQHMGPYLKRNFPDDDFSLYVVEQTDDKVFNKGVMINSGLTEIYKNSPGTHCVTLHDVDLIPKFDGVPYTSCEQPIQLGSELEHFDWSYPYPMNAGGVISMHMMHWRKINGMSNDYEGWGGEDDDLYFRLRRNDLLLNPKRNNPDNPEIVRPPKGKGVFINLELHATTEGNRTIEKQPIIKENQERKSSHEYYPNNICLLMMMQTAKSDRWKYDGVNDLNYEVFDDTIVQNVNGSDGFFEIHHMQVVGHENNSTASLKCMRSSAWKARFWGGKSSPPKKDWEKMWWHQN